MPRYIYTNNISNGPLMTTGNESLECRSLSYFLDPNNRLPPRVSPLWGLVLIYILTAVIDQGTNFQQGKTSRKSLNLEGALSF